MERNDGSVTAGHGGTSDANEFSGSGTRPIDSFDFSGSAGITEQTKVRGGVRERLAGVLESGAEKLRERGARATAGSAAGTPDTSSATFAGVTGGGRVTVETDAGDRAPVTERVAGGMDAAANWIREADVDGLRQGLERQVKEHPGRTLLIAAGLGYLIGRALRK